MLDTNFPGKCKDTQGVNLVFGSAVEHTGSYAIHEYTLSEPFEIGAKYTLTIWGKLEEGKTQFNASIGSSSLNMVSDQSLPGVYYSYIIDRTVPWADDTDKTKITLYTNLPSIDITSAIYRIKLERGTVTNPVWTPAPEDVLLKGEVDGRNLLIKSTAGKGCYIRGDGTNVMNDSYSTSDYMSINPGEILTLSDVVSGKTCWVSPAWYNESKEYLGGYITNGILSKFVETVVVPESTKYVRFSYYTNNKPKVERGDTATDWTPAPEDVVTKTPYDIFEALDGIPEMHRNLYRGRNLGESTQMSEAHKAAIQDGSFRDLFVGDYWTHDSINYRIADVDYFYNCGDTTFTKHHLVIVPDTRLSDGKMNTDNTTENGYVGSEMRQTGLEQAKEKIQAAFPDMVLTHRDYFTNKVTNGVPSEGEWTNSDVELMNEIMVYGCHIFAPANNGTIAPNKYTTGNSQLALFRLNPRMIKTRYNYWLRDVFSAAAFALVNNYGLANCVNASYSNGVRPYFCIGVQAAGDEADDDMEVVGAVESTERMEADEMGDGADTGAETDATKTHDEIESDANEKDMEDV